MDRQTHDDSIYGASIASRSKNGSRSSSSSHQQQSVFVFEYCNITIITITAVGLLVAALHKSVK